MLILEITLITIFSGIVNGYWYLTLKNVEDNIRLAQLYNAETGEYLHASM